MSSQEVVKALNNSERGDCDVVDTSRHDAVPNTHARRSARSTSVGFSICTAITASSD
jgi:hypothetical protein